MMCYDSQWWCEVCCLNMFKLTSKLKYYIWSQSIFVPGIIQTLESGHCHANGVDLNSTNPLWRGINSQGNVHLCVSSWKFIRIIQKTLFFAKFRHEIPTSNIFSQFVDGRWNSIEFIRDPIWSAALKVQALASASVERRYGCSPEDMTMAGLQNALELRI